MVDEDALEVVGGEKNPCHLYSIAASDCADLDRSHRGSVRTMAVGESIGDIVLGPIPVQCMEKKAQGILYCPVVFVSRLSHRSWLMVLSSRQSKRYNRCSALSYYNRCKPVGGISVSLAKGRRNAGH